MATTTTPAPRGGPPGMPAHLWELAKSDVATAVPEAVRRAAGSGANAPASIRRLAARVAATGAAFGIAAAVVSVGGSFADASEPVVPAVDATPLHDGLDPVPPVAGSGDAGHGSHAGASGHSGYGGHGAGSPGDGGVHFSTSGTGDVASGLGSTWHVQDTGPGGTGHTLTIQIFQEVSVHETADGMFVVDAYQYIVVDNGHGGHYVFSEHYHTTVPDPPGHETDLIVHERGYVHVVENPDGSFRLEDSHHTIEVTAGSDGDGKDEVAIHQDEKVDVHDRDPHHGDQVRIDLGEKADSTTDDAGDEASTTIDQSQALDGRDQRERPDHVGGPQHGSTDGPGNIDGQDGTDRTGTGAQQPGSSPASAPATTSTAPTSTTSATPTTAASTAAGASSTAATAQVPLVSTLAGVPVAAVAWQVEAPGDDVALLGGPAPVNAATAKGVDGDPPAHGPAPFHGAGTPAPAAPFAPASPDPHAGAASAGEEPGQHPVGTGGTTGAGTSPVDGGTGQDGTGHDGTGHGGTGVPGIEHVDPSPPVDPVSAPPEQHEQPAVDHSSGSDPTHHDGDHGADPALVS